ncbi:ATP-dependent rRNA helicase rrp3 [Exophiala viscosa]|uniref:RNA helicase n=1 Tax=Exophiala viscosa TaxID=2486360 RepID=A0AAN6ICF4_9EURO|nr:ATP-dependent rRNA helicase rrp3 [Exophiala viscosa]KAI1625786.1 ATP-dependent rRNA helicase rrp3 [Exophiala viscosa]
MASSPENSQANSLPEDGQCSANTPPSTFQDLGIEASLCEACSSLGFQTPTPIQAQAIPPALEGRDLIALAETGSRKTVAYLLPIMQHLFNHPQGLHSLILAPTRKLALQIAKVIEALGASKPFQCAVLIGGVHHISQAMAIGKKPHIIVETPGRLLDHLENTQGFRFSLSLLKYLVFDEADRLLDTGFGPELDQILKLLPPRRTFIYAAKTSDRVDALQRARLSNPLRISVASGALRTLTVATLLQSYVFIPHQHKDLYLVHILGQYVGRTGIIFTRMIREAQRLCFMLQNLGFSAAVLHGKLSQTSREKASLLVTTDHAACRLDVDLVDFVLKYDIPYDSETYIRQVRRTARARKSGRAFSFLTQYDVELWMRIENALGERVEDYAVVREEVMRQSLRVSDAQRVAAEKMRDLVPGHEARQGSQHEGGRIRRGADMDWLRAEMRNHVPYDG